MRHEKKCCEIPGLRRALGFWQACICGMGIILGAGIYALIGVAAGSGGSALWLGFLIAGIIAGLTGLSYAELSSIFKRDAAEYDYVNKAFGRAIAWLLAMTMIFAAIFTSSTVALGFGGYIFGLTGWNILWSAVALVLILTVINFSGIKESVLINTVFTLIEASGLLFIIILGIKSWGSVDLWQMPQGFSGVMRSAALVFFAFIGFESIVKLTEETRDPEKNIPRAVIFSIILSTIIYILVAVSAVSVLDWQALHASSSPLADVARAGLGGYTFVIIAVIALFSTTNTVLMDLVTTSRAVYGMAKERVLPHVLGSVQAVTRTPHYAVLAVSSFTVLFVFIGDIERVASIANFFTFLTFGLVNFSVVALRFTYKKRRPFCVPGSVYGVALIPLIGGIASLGMLYYVFAGIV